MRAPYKEECSGDSVVSFWTIWGVIPDEGRRTTSPRSVCAIVEHVDFSEKCVRF